MNDTRLIAVGKPDGGCALLFPAPGCGLTLEQIAEKDVPAGLLWRIVAPAELPGADEDFFDAWTYDAGTGKVGVDLARAREVTKARLRREREPLLAALDVQFMRALEAGQDTRAIAAEKQRLRDVPQLVDKPATLAELRALRAAA